MTTTSGHQGPAPAPSTHPSSSYPATTFDPVAALQHLRDVSSQQLTAPTTPEDDANRASVWFLPEEEQLHSYLYAMRMRRVIANMLQLATAEDPNFTAGQLTLAQLEADKGKLRRKIHGALLHQTELRPAEANRLIRDAVGLHQHGQDVLTACANGTLRLEQAAFFSKQLASYQLPHPRTRPDGKPWEPGEYQDHVAATEAAQRTFGEAFTELAARHQRLPDLAAAAESFRQEHHPQPAAQRHQQAAARRFVKISGAADGMAHLQALIPADAAVGIQRRLATTAAQLGRTGHAQGRTHTQLQADVFIDLLQSTTPQADQPAQAGNAPDSATTTSSPAAAGPAGGGVQPVIFVSLTLQEAIGLGQFIEPERLGFLKTQNPELYAQSERNRRHWQQLPRQRESTHPPGVIESGIQLTPLGTDLQLGTAASADLLAHGSLFRLLLRDGYSGYPLGIGRRSYRVPQKIRQLIMLRDQRCRFPGCHVPAYDCEVDHVQEWAGSGTTGYDANVLFCKEHHTGKTARWWQVELIPEAGDGVLKFTHRGTGDSQQTQPALPLAADAWDAYRHSADAADPPPF